MTQRSIFADEWRDCLRSHFLHVVRVRDQVTEHTLVSVMHDAGFTDIELAELRVLATLRTEDVADDFVPEATTLEAFERKVEAAVAAELIIEEQSSEIAPVEAMTPPADEYYAPPDDTPQQLTLF